MKINVSDENQRVGSADLDNMEMSAVTASALLFVGVFMFVSAGELYKDVFIKRNKQCLRCLNVTSQMFIFIFHIQFVYVFEGITSCCLCEHKCLVCNLNHREKEL